MEFNGGTVNNVNQNGNNNIFPIIIDRDNQDKLTEDRYEVYVNNDYVGDKTLLNEAEKIEDVDHFISLQGIENFSTKLDGDHYHIMTDNHTSSQLKDILSVYFNNR